MMPAGAVSRLWRYPVKSMLGEECAAIVLDARGCEGDRLFAVRAADGRLGSGKTTGQLCRIDGLFGFGARLSGEVPEIAFPDGRRMLGSDPRFHGALSAALGVPVALAREAEVRHFDSGAVHLVSTAALAWLRSKLPGSRIDERRFRPNILFAAEGAAQVEHAWIGRTLRVGAGVRLRVTERTERCRMTTLAQGELPEDPEVLRCLARHADLQFGIYAEVVTPGRIACGDPLSVE